MVFNFTKQIVTRKVEILEGEKSDDASNSEEEADFEGSSAYRLRSWSEVLHRILFFIAGNFHIQCEKEICDVKKADFSSSEDKYYKLAQDLRIKILQEYEKAWETSISQYLPNFRSVDIEIKKEEHVACNNYYGGILTNEFFSDFSVLYEILNNQLKIMQDFRFKVMTSVCCPLEEEADEVQGDEFEKGVFAVIMQGSFTGNIKYIPRWL